MACVETDALRDLGLCAVGLGAFDRAVGKKIAALRTRASLKAGRGMVLDCDYQDSRDLAGFMDACRPLPAGASIVLVRLLVGTEEAVKRKMADPTWHAGEPKTFRESEVRRCHRYFTPTPIAGEVEVPTDGRAKEEVYLEILSAARQRQ